VPRASLAGRAYPPVRFTIEPETVAAFARALGEEPASGVPPTYAAVYALATTVPQLFADQEAAVDVARLVHGEQEFEWERHPELGETIDARGRIVEDVERRNLRFLTFETTCAGQDGAPVCRSRMLSVIR
jgi:N-terminal half of MaoC dehydratase